ncbi:MAG: flagellar hook-basal body protein [Candidatus Kapaibacteriales bacterium]
MIKELFIGAIGMIPQQTKLEIVANNIANANTIGFKKDSTFEREISIAQDELQTFVETNKIGLQRIGKYTNFSKGNFEQTGNPLDIAIENPNAFFLLEDTEGNQYLTRAGKFNLNKDGSIVATDGKYLLGESGIINLYRELFISSSTIENNIIPQIKITRSGEVFVNQAFIGKIQLVEVENLDTLERVDGALFRISDKTILHYPQIDDVVIRQGWLESSNVNIVDELIKMIELQRQFDLGGKVVQTNDNLLDQSIKISRVY